MVGLVGVVVLAISGVYFHELADKRLDDAHDRSAANAESVKSFVLERVAENMRYVPRPPRTVDESRQLWVGMIRDDLAVRYLLRNLVANSTSILDIVITDSDGVILSAPDGEQLGQKARRLPSFRDWNSRSVLSRLVEVFGEDSEFEITIPLGVAEQHAAFFYIRAVVSTVMLRDALFPDLRHLATVSGAILLLSVLVAAIAASLLLRPLERLNRAIDRLSRGEMSTVEPALVHESREFATVQRKLGMLARQFRGAQEDVIQLRQNIGKMLQRMEEAVLLFDAGGQLVAAGRPAERLLGIPHSALIGRPLEELFPESSPLGIAIDAARTTGDALRDYPVTIQADGGPPARVLLNVDPLGNPDGTGALGLIVTLRDAETRNQLETQLDVSTRLAAISRLTGGVAHEVKNPLNAIALHIEVLRAQLSKQNTAVESELEIISGEISRLDRVVKTFIDFTRPVALDMRAVNLVGVVREAVSHLNLEAGRRGVQISLRTSSETATLLGDNTMLRQAVMNILVNAIEAMKDGGRVEVELKPSHGDHMLSISDEGSGIPPEIRDKIFNLFYTTKKTGSGIGLAIAFQVVQLHNGTIECQSRPQGGTVFSLRFPAIREATPRALGAGGDSSE